MDEVAKVFGRRHESEEASTPIDEKPHIAYVSATEDAEKLYEESQK